MSETIAAPARARRGRPPKGGAKGHADTRAQLIRVGLAVLTEKGYSSTGLDEILKQAGVPKGSFYHYFDSKEVFGQVLIDAYADYFAHKLARWLEDEQLSPRARLAGFIEDARKGMAAHDFRRGCLIGNLGQEMAALPETFRLQLIAVFSDWQQRTRDCLREGQALGEIAAAQDVNELARFFWIGWEGAVLRARLEQSPQPLDTFARGFFRLLDAV